MPENIERINQVYYALYSNAFGEKVIQEPDGWESDFKSYERDKDSRGILSKTEVNLEFFGEASDYLDTIYSNFGISETTRLAKYEADKSTLSEAFKNRYIQKLDLGTYVKNEKTGGVKVKATQGGLYDDIKNRETDEYDVINSTSADALDIGVLETVPFQPKGRELFVESLLESENIIDYRINSQRFARTSNATSKTVRAIPLEIVYNSDQDDIVNPLFSGEYYNNVQGSQSYDIGQDQEIGNLFFYEAEGDETIKITLELDYRITQVAKRRSEDVDFAIEIFITEKNGVADELVERITIDNFIPSTQIGVEKNITYETTIDVLKNGSVGAVFTTVMNYNGSITAPNGEMDVYLNILNAKLVVENTTDYTSFVSVGRAIKPLVFFDRLVAKITGETGLVKSSIFGAGGEYENILIDNGLWARGFPDTYEDAQGAEQSVQMTISFKDAFLAMNYLEPLTWFIENTGNKQYVRIEKATYTMQNFIALRLGTVDKIDTKASLPDYFSTITIGHSKSMEYEEINGRDETNGKSIYGTFIKDNDSTYEVLSKIRPDATGYELTRREDFINNPKSDNKRDADLWMHDTKLVNGVYTHRLWQDIFDEEPTGIYSPDTAWNLFLSPINRLYYGHGYSVKRGLYHFPNRKITFGSSNANENLTTVINGVSLSENGQITVGDLEKPRIEATTKTLTFKMTQEIQDVLDGNTKIGDDYVPNVFGLIEFDEKGEKVYGRLTKLENKDEAKLELIKARL